MEKGRTSGYGNTDNDRRIFSDIKLSEFIAKAKNRPAMTKEVELERIIQRIGKIQGRDSSKDDPKMISVMAKAFTEAVIPGTRITVKYQKGSTKIVVNYGGIYETD